MHSKGETAAATAGFCLLTWSSKEDDDGEEKKGKGPNDPVKFLYARQNGWVVRSWSRFWCCWEGFFFLNSFTERRVYNHNTLDAFSHMTCI